PRATPGRCAPSRIVGHDRAGAHHLPPTCSGPRRPGGLIDADRDPPVAHRFHRRLTVHRSRIVSSDHPAYAEMVTAPTAPSSPRLPSPSSDARPADTVRPRTTGAGRYAPSPSGDLH